MGPTDTRLGDGPEHDEELGHRVLVVDDDDFLRATLSERLGKEGFRVRGAANGAAMFQQMARFDPDLVILDVRMPGEDGMQLLRKLRDAGNPVPVIMLTAKSDTVDKVLGLELGADDYMTKPFDASELLARLHARLRGTSVGGARKGVRRFEGWTLDLDSHTLRDPDDGAVELTSHEFKALAAFANHPGRVLDREQLMDLIVGRSWSPSDRSIDVLIAKLRKQLRDDPRHPRFIKTIHGAGYMFAPKVERA